MNLENFSAFSKLDTLNLLAEIDDLPEQLQAGWELGQSLPLPDWKGLRQVVFAGMGDSAMGAELLAAYAAPLSPVPIVVLRDYDLPAWANGSHTLVVALSRSEDTEETLSVFQQATQRRCRCLAVGAGGDLLKMANAADAPAWQYEPSNPAGTQVAFTFGLLAAAFYRMRWLPDLGAEFRRAVATLYDQQNSLKADIPPMFNPAKRMAGQMMGRWVTIVGSGLLVPVARHWRNQINQMAKSQAQVDFLPEMDHSALAGVLQPEEMLGSTMFVFLRSALNHPHNRLRSDLTKTAFMLEGIGTDFVDAKGVGPLSQQWTSLHYGDYVAYYLAMAYGVDPAPSPAIEHMKQEIRRRSD